MIRLERFEHDDFKQLIDWISDEQLLTSWSGGLFSFPLTKDSLEWYISDTNIPGSSDAFVYKVADAIDGSAVGHISLGGISWKNRSARITRVFLADKVRNKGYCQAMVKAVLKIGFEELQLHRISLGVYDDNTSALKCYEKSGLEVEGIYRDVLWYKQKWWSMIEMSMLEDDWKELNKNHA
ncbi:GNAT family protein [soil metagenome]